MHEAGPYLAAGNKTCGTITYNIVTQVFVIIGSHYNRGEFCE